MEEEIIASLHHIDYRKSMSTLSEEMAQLSATQHYQVFPELRRERKQPIIFYKTVTTPQDSKQLQEDLHKICEWTHKWQMKINVEKCAVLRCTRSLNPIQYTYTLSGRNVDIKKCHTYLGVAIDNTMSWSSHIQTVSNRATKVLNFIKRNLNNCPSDTKRTAYLTLVRPIMEYAAPCSLHGIRIITLTFIS